MWALLLIPVVIAVIVAPVHLLLFRVWYRFPVKAIWILCGVTAGLITLATATLYSPWSFRQQWLQGGLIATVCLAATCLPTAIGRLNLRGLWKWCAPTLAVLVTLAVYIFIVLFAWFDSPSNRATETRVADRIIWRRDFGGLAGNDWVGVRIVYQPRYLPLLEKRLFSMNVGEDETCNENVLHVEKVLESHTVRVECGWESPKILGEVQLP